MFSVQGQPLSIELIQRKKGSR
ncbi:hypothetical protein D039_0362A, partial [Vibrio parahaemolyticus EKP-028]